MAETRVEYWVQRRKVGSKWSNFAGWWPEKWRAIAERWLSSFREDRDGATYRLVRRTVAESAYEVID